MRPGQLVRDNRDNLSGTTGRDKGGIRSIPLSRPVLSHDGQSLNYVSTGRPATPETTLEAPQSVTASDSSGSQVLQSSARGQVVDTTETYGATVTALSRPERSGAADSSPSGALGPETGSTFPRTPAEAIGTIRPGVSVFTLTAGGFSVVDVLAHVLDATGPATVCGSTWTVSEREAWRLARLLTSGRVARLRLLVDDSLARRKPEAHAVLCERFGVESVAFTRTHAKFMVIQGGGLSLVVTTSSNLDRVVRLEWLALRDDAALADRLAGVVDRLFDAARRGESLARFVEAERPVLPYFGAGPLARDLRRSGWSFARSGEVLR